MGCGCFMSVWAIIAGIIAAVGVIGTAIKAIPYILLASVAVIVCIVVAVVLYRGKR